MNNDKLWRDLEGHVGYYEGVVEEASPVEDVGQGDERDVLHAGRCVMQGVSETINGFFGVSNHAPVQRSGCAQHPRIRILQFTKIHKHYIAIVSKV